MNNNPAEVAMGSDQCNRMRQFFLTGKFPELPGAVNAETLRAAYGEPTDIVTDHNSSYYLYEQAEYLVYDASPTQLFVYLDKPVLRGRGFSMRPLHKRMSPYSLIRLLADMEINWMVHERLSRWQQLTIQTEGGYCLRSHWSTAS